MRWTIDATLEKKKINAFEMYCYRRILRISWIQKVKHTEVLNKLGKNLEVVQTIKNITGR